MLQSHYKVASEHATGGYTLDYLLNSPLGVGGIRFENRVCFQPMEGCDCNTDGTPSELTVAKYISAAQSGAGLIWVEACAVCPEGRTTPRQMMLTSENVGVFKAFVADLRRIALEECGVKPVFILQLTHSGRQSIVPMIAYRHPIYEATRPVSDDNIVSDEYIDTLPDKYVHSARLAIEAGFDGVDVKSCHGYLMQELLSSFTRGGRYGGSFVNRTRLYLDAIRAVKAAVPSDFLVVTRLGISDMVPYPYGFGTTAENELDLREPDMLIEKIMSLGISLLNVTIGNPYYNSHVNRPFRKGAYTPPEEAQVGLERFKTVERHIKEKFPGLTLIGSGLSYYRDDLIEQSESQLRSGICDMVGYGREWLAYPMFYRDFRNGNFNPKRTCASCSRCTALMRAGCVAGCAMFNDYYKKLYGEKVK